MKTSQLIQQILLLFTFTVVTFDHHHSTSTLLEITFHFISKVKKITRWIAQEVQNSAKFNYC